MADDHDKSEASLHTVDLETLGEDHGVSLYPGDNLCVSCWALFDGAALPTCPSCGELAPKAGWASLPYRFLDRYEFLELLGRGGVGAVFRAKHVDEARGEQQFAVKVVQQGAQPERRRLLSQMFEREISAAALLGRSRHFVRVLGHDTGDHLHLAMEYVPWPTLKRRLRNDGIMPPRHVARLGIALLHAAEVMHAHNLVHRDLKPANIFVTEEDGELRVKVADLGLWVLSEDRRGDVTESLPAGTFAGTLDYASPEQLDGVNIGLPSDLHAIASILWAAATGDVPFPAIGPSFLASMKSKRQLVEAVPARPASMPEPLYDVLAKALQPAIEDRYQTAREFADALEILVQDSEAFSSTIHIGSTPSRSVLRPRNDPARLKSTTPPPTPRARKPVVWPRWAAMAGAGAAALGGAYFLASKYFVPTVQPAASASVAPVGSQSAGPLVVPGPPATGPRVRALSLGSSHTCAVLADRSARCWGSNTRGQLGDGTMIGRSQPTKVAGLSQVKDIATGRTHTCARAEDDRVWCWGDNTRGQLGDGTATTRAAPMLVDGLPSIARLYVGGCHAWALTAEGQAWGWGCDDGGQLGEPRTRDARPRRLPTLDGARKILVWDTEDSGVACALFDDRPAACWSWGGDDGHARAASSLDVPAELAIAGDHGCGLMATGRLYCWGANDTGQVGDGTRERRPMPVEIANAPYVEQVVVGVGYSCARVTSGRVVCWGRNDHGQLGLRGHEDQLVPTTVPSIENAKQIVTDQGRTCALVEGGRVACWGAGLSERAGEPVWMAAMVGAEQLVSSRAGLICGVAVQGGAACVGDDEHGQLGVGRTLQRLKPARIEGIEKATGLWASARNVCAVDEQRQLWCWGSNHWGAFRDAPNIQPKPVRIGQGVVDVAMGNRGLYTVAEDEQGQRAVRAGGTLLFDHGSGLADDLFYPQTVTALTGAMQIVAGVRHGCGRMADGSLACWGDNTYGQLGDGSARFQRKPTPAATQGKVSQVATGGFHACALRDSGSVLCWGSNGNGQTGPGPTWTCAAGPRLFPCVRKPRKVIGAEGVVQLAAGQWHSCGLTKSGAVVCWGANRVGQLGDGTTVERATPGPVKGVTGALHLAVGEQHACAVLRSGAVWCWGDNGHGELGRATTDKCGPAKESCGPTAGPVSDVAEVSRVAVGWEFSCALRKDGTVWCWGNNQRGALGDGVASDRDRAVPVRF